MRKSLLAAITAFVVGVALALQPMLPAAAVNAPLDRLVSTTPGTNTPNILNGATRTITKVGSRIVAGGTFTSVAPPGGSTGVSRDYVVAFDESSGAIEAQFNPTLDGAVESVEPGPTDDTVYVGGNFKSVNGTAQRGVALLDLKTGQRVQGFNPASITGGGVTTVRLSGGHLLVAGKFTKVGGKAHAGLVSLNPTTGAVESYVDLQLAGHHNYRGQPGQAKGGVGAVAMDVTPDGSRMTVIGNFTTVNGEPRDQIAMIDLGPNSASLDENWSTLAYSAACFNWAFDTYMRAVDVSPDGDYFVVTATGGSGTNSDGTNSTCDSAARFETNATGSNIRPTWIDYTGQDTLTAVAVTSAAVYVGGHERWMNNSTGYDYAGQGAVPRPGLAALDPKTGVPFSWNAARHPRGVGTQALFATPSGLYEGSDTDYIGNRKYTRQRIGFFPVSGGQTVPEPKTPSLPSDVYLASPLSQAAGNTNVLFRVNAGGPALAALDSGPDWMADQSDSDPGAAFRNSGSSSSAWSSGASMSTSVPATTPNAIFDSERYDSGSKGDGGEMKWHFPVTQGTKVEVRLYFANRYSGTSQPGQRVFDVALDGSTVLPNYDIVADVGDQTGTMQQFDIVSDGEVDIDFTHEVENPLIDGIEILKQGDDATPPTAGLLERSFDGTSAGQTSPVTTDGIDWSTVRGSFVINNELFYGSSDGYLYKRTFDGTTFGPAIKIDPYDDPDWSNVSTGSGQTYRGAKPDVYGQMNSVAGMFYLDGKLYYSRLGSTQLYARWFQPESGIIGSDTFRVSGGDFSNTAGMFYSNGHIYFADRKTGDLKRVDFDGTSVDGASLTSVSGPGIDGNDWASRGLFLAGPGQQPNQPPVAAFEASCQQNVCDVDASGSSDPDGSVASYAWEFGDGSGGAGKTASHAYSTAGDYTVKLTVTDNDGATASVSKQVTPAAPPESSIAYVDGAHSGTGASKSKSVTIPESASPGDTMVLFFTQASDATWTGVGDDWTQVGTFENGSIRSTVWTKPVVTADVGSKVTLSVDKYTKGALSVSVYSGVDPTDVVAAHAGDSRTATHVTPTVTAAAGDLVISYWADKSSGTTEWSAPKAVTARDTAVGAGAGRYSFLVGDSDQAVSAGEYGGLTATTDAQSGKAAMWTIALTPGSVPKNQPPVAAFEASCQQNVCDVDASGSSDPDGSVASYAWEFGDGSGGAGKTASHAYSTAGDYTVKLTVTDNDGATASVSKQVTPAAPPESSIAYVDGAHSGTGASKSKSVTIPESASPGDTMVLFFTQASDATWTGVGDDWTQVGTFENGSIRSTVWTKPVVTADVGSKVTLSVDKYTKGALSVSVYSGVDPTDVVAAHAGDSRTATHVTPTVTAAAGDLVISYWADKSSGTTEWSAPKAVTARDTAVGAGAGRYSFLVGDSDQAVSAGEYGGLTATTDAQSGKAAMWTIALTPESGA